MNAASRQRGVGLVEVLVAVTVLAIGMLGIAAMQATALHNRQSAVERSEAVVHSYGILERMRANHAVAANGGYDLATMTCNPPTTTSPSNSATISSTRLAPRWRWRAFTAGAPCALAGWPSRRCRGSRPTAR